MTPYERVRLSRERTAATFPLPNVLDCIRYAITELAEYEDALLRQERASDKRNNDKQHDPRSELGQALYMLLSAAVQFGEPSEPRRLPAVSVAGLRATPGCCKALSTLSASTTQTRPIRPRCRARRRAKSAGLTASVIGSKAIVTGAGTAVRPPALVSRLII